MTYIHHSRRARMPLVMRRRLCARGHLRAKSVCAPVCIQTTDTDVPLFFADEHEVGEGEVPYWVYSPYGAPGSRHRGCYGDTFPIWGYGVTNRYWTEFRVGTSIPLENIAAVSTQFTVVYRNVAYKKHNGIYVE